MPRFPKNSAIIPTRFRVPSLGSFSPLVMVAWSEFWLVNSCFSLCSHSSQSSGYQIGIIVWYHFAWKSLGKIGLFISEEWYMDQDTLIGGFEVEGNAKVVLLSEHFYCSTEQAALQWWKWSIHQYRVGGPVYSGSLKKIFIFLLKTKKSQSRIKARLPPGRKWR